MGHESPESSTPGLTFGVCVGTSDKFDTVLKPSLARYEPSARLIVRRGVTSIFAGYNSILHEVRDSAGPLVLVHDDVELTAPLAPVLDATFSDASVGLVGTLGSRKPAGMSWWTAPESERRGFVQDNFDRLDYGFDGPDVDVVDGFLIALSPWSVSNVVFDDRRYRGFHGYDSDVSATVRSLGKRVVVARLPVVHRNKQGAANWNSYRAAELTYLGKWADGSPGKRASWRTGKTYHRLRERIRPQYF